MSRRPLSVLPDDTKSTLSMYLERSKARELNDNPGLLNPPLESTCPFPADLSLITPTSDILVDADHTICIAHTIEVNRTNEKCVVTGTSPIFNELKGYDVIFLVDTDIPNATAMEAIANLTQLAEPYLDRKVKLAFTCDYITDSPMALRPNETLQDRFDCFRPGSRRGGGPRNLAMEVVRIVKYHLEEHDMYRKNPKIFRDNDVPKPLNLIVITDCGGLRLEKTQELLSFITDTSKRLEAEGYPPSHLGIQFVALRDSLPHRRIFEALDLDVSAVHGARDIVDWTLYNPETLNAATLIKILLGAIDRRVDRGLRSEVPIVPALPKDPLFRKRRKRRIGFLG